MKGFLRIASFALLAISAQLAAQTPQVRRAALAKKLETIVFPTVEIQNATYLEALNYLRKRSFELDGAEPDAGPRGINFVVIKHPDKIPPRIELQMQTVPAGEVLRILADKAGLQFAVSEYFVGIYPKDAPPVRVPNEQQGTVKESLLKVVMPRLDIQDTSLREGADFIRLRDADLDRLPGYKKVQIIFEPTAHPDARIAELRIREVPLFEVLRLMAIMTDHRMRSDDNSIIFYR